MSQPFRTQRVPALLMAMFAVLSLLLAASAGRMRFSFQVVGVALGLALLLVPELIRWRALAVPRVAWSLGWLAVGALLAIQCAGPGSFRTAEEVSWLSLSVVLLVSLALTRAPLKLPGRVSLVALWLLLLLGLRATPHFTSFLVGLALSLLLLWKRGWRSTALLLALGGLSLFAWALHAHPTAFFRLTSFWAGDDLLGRNYSIHLARRLILRSWPLGPHPMDLEGYLPLPQLFHHEFVLAKLALAFAWPGVLLTLTAYAFAFQRWFRLARRHPTLEADLLWGLGTLMALLTGLSLANLLHLQPWSMPLPLLSAGASSLTVLFLAAGSLWLKLSRKA